MIGDDSGDSGAESGLLSVFRLALIVLVIQGIIEPQASGSASVRSIVT